MIFVLPPLFPAALCPSLQAAMNETDATGCVACLLPMRLLVALMLSRRNDLMEVSGQTYLTPEGHPVLLNQLLKVSVVRQKLFDKQRLSVVVSAMIF